LHLLQ